MKRRLLLVGAVLSTIGCADPVGLDVEVNVTGFQGAAVLRVILRAEGGFVAHPPEGVGGRVQVASQDVDGNGVLALVVDLPFPAASEKFRVTTGNKETLTVTGEARVFDAAKLVALGAGNTSLTGGGHATLPLTVTPYTGEVVSPKMRSTDLLSAAPDVKVQGTQAAAPLKAMAVCDLDKDGHDDIVLGAPNADPGALGPAGAVYVVFGDGASATFDVGKGAKEFHFFSNESGAKLGTAVACADLNGDGYGDLIAGAPGAAKDTGKIYVVFGRPNLQRTTIDLAKPANQPDVTWTTAAPAAALGSVLFAADLDGAGGAELLATAPGASLVHLFSGIVQSATPIDADKPDHPTFAGVKAASLGAGRFKSDTGPMDIALGDPEFLPENNVEKTGVVYVFAAVPPATPRAYAVSATDATGPAIAMVGGEGSQFGAAVLGLDTTTRGQDLFVGAPKTGTDAVGQVFVYEHNDSFFVAKTRAYSTAKKIVPGHVPNGQFGASLAGTPSGLAPAVTWRLLVGAPAALRGKERSLAGAAYLLGSDAARTFPVLDEMFGAAVGALLGSVVAGGHIDGNTDGDLVTLAPGALGTVAGAGAVYVKYGQ